MWFDTTFMTLHLLFTVVSVDERMRLLQSGQLHGIISDPFLRFVSYTWVAYSCIHVW